MRVGKQFPIRELSGRAGVEGFVVRGMNPFGLLWIALGRRHCSGPHVGGKVATNEIMSAERVGAAKNPFRVGCGL